VISGVPIVKIKSLAHSGFVEDLSSIPSEPFLYCAYCPLVLRICVRSADCFMMADLLSTDALQPSCPRCCSDTNVCVFFAGQAATASAANSAGQAARPDWRGQGGHRRRAGHMHTAHAQSVQHMQSVGIHAANTAFKAASIGNSSSSSEFGTYGTTGTVS